MDDTVANLTLLKCCSHRLQVCIWAATSVEPARLTAVLQLVCILSKAMLLPLPCS